MKAQNFLAARRTTLGPRTAVPLFLVASLLCPSFSWAAETSATGKNLEAPAESSTQDKSSSPKDGEASSQEASKPEGSPEAQATTEPEKAAAKGEENGESPSPTVATSPSEEERKAAMAAFEEGQEKYNQALYSEAFNSFEKAYQLIPSPHAEYWMARCLDKADSEQQSAANTATAYEIFLANPGATYVGADEVQIATNRLEELKKYLPAKVKISTNPEGAPITIDGVSQKGVTPLDVELEAGDHEVQAMLDGYATATIEIAPEGGSNIEQTIALSTTEEKEPAVVTKTVQPSAQQSKVPIIVTLSLSGASLVTGSVFGVLALTGKKKFNDDPTSNQADKVERNALIADMCFGAAITLGVTGIVLLTAKNKKQAAEKMARSRLMVAPVVSKEGGGAAARWRF
ncbi:MAG: PEGA domain-containing protein [Polyangiaceae bacterium]|nr:PEGA domain-containing protein [Polyangiaceae bacterium]